jgi:hypothetical protein
MNLTRILSISFLVVALALFAFLVSRIKFAIDEEIRIENVEKIVIRKLEMIRVAQIAYQSVNGQYANTWEKLVDFVNTGDFYIIQRSEEIITLSYGRDSVIVHLDTLGTVPVIDSLFKKQKYADFTLADLPIIPESGGKKFDLFTEKITKGGITVDVIEVRDIAPANPMRRESNEARNRKPLRFGSRTDVTTSGNWE